MSLRLCWRWKNTKLDGCQWSMVQAGWSELSAKPISRFASHPQCNWYAISVRLPSQLKSPSRLADELTRLRSASVDAEGIDPQFHGRLIIASLLIAAVSLSGWDSFLRMLSPIRS